jgi:cell division protein FtsI (penicillin-binding protein 3)
MALLSTSSKTPRRLLGRPEAQELSVGRLPYLWWGMLVWAMAILLRLLWLQGVEHRRYQRQAESQHTTTVEVPPIRGEIRDRRGEALAISLRSESLFCDPRTFYPNYRHGRTEAERSWGQPDRKAAGEVAAQLAPILEMPKALVMERLLRQKPFVYLERQLPASKVAAIKALDLDGLEFIQESRRVYPRGTLASQIIGFTNIDGIGQLGIEQTYESVLAGRKGAFVASRDAKGRLRVMQERFTQVPANGSTLQLTIDSTIQHIVEDALEEAVRLSKPATAYAVVVDPNTGEILAMAGTPRFDPNHVLPKKFRYRGRNELSGAELAEYDREIDRQKAARKVHPVEDAYEPGSTMKIFTAAMALEERKVHLGEKFDCMGGRWQYSAKIPPITDTHKHGVLSFEEILWQSSNIGAAKMGTRLDPAVHYQYLRKFGFGEPTGLSFPGETNGRLPAPDQWSVPTQYTLSYGYGLNGSPLQVLMAGCALANGGKLMKPILVQKIYNDQGALLKENRPEVRGQVISEETSALMREALKGVITQGTGKRAKLELAEAFGKTGTSRKLINGQYEMKRHYASFMGFFPADKPEYGILVMLDDPAGDVDGGGVAAPVFKRIGDAILRYRQTGDSADRAADLKLSLRDWPTSESDEAVVHVEEGRVPDLAGLSLKAALQRVVLVGGVPRVEGRPSSDRALRVTGQSPAAGAELAHGQTVVIRVGGSG